MSTKYKASNPDKAYFVTITTVGWVDLFTRLNHKNLITLNNTKMKELKFFSLINSTEPKIIGTSYPQIIDFIPEKNEAFSIDEFCNWKGIEYKKTPILNNYLLSKKSKTTDVLSCGLCPGGDIIISENFKDILLNYNMGPLQIFNAGVTNHNNKIFDYYLIHFNYQLEKFINFKATVFNIDHHPTLALKPLLNYEDYIEYRSINRKKILTAEKLVFTDKFDVTLDLFSISWFYQEVLISIKLKDKLLEGGISGVDFVEKSIFIST